MKAQSQAYWEVPVTAGLAILAIALVVVLVLPGSALAQPSKMPTFQSPLASISLSPSDLSLPLADSTGTTDVQVSNVSNLAGVEFHFSFDPTQLQVESAAGGAFFNQNGVPMPLVPVFNNTTGKVDFVGSIVAPAAPFSGAGPVAVGSVTWKLVTCPATGSIPLNFSNTKLSNSNGGTISYDAVNGQVTCDVAVPTPTPTPSPTPTPLPTPTPTPTPGPSTPLVGMVLLQGRTDQSGTDVYLTEDACPAVQAVSVKGLPNVVSAVTDAAGNFTLTPLAGHTYQCVLASHDKYLTARKSAPSSDLGTVTLPGGNVVADKSINIFDLARIANAIGTSDPTSDVNGDGSVDIYDLTIAAGNFGKEGPVAW
jgi:hypothetical protein